MTIAIDTETTGLFIHKGCRPFIISAADDSNKTYIWEFSVNPYTREVIYDEKLEHFRDILAKHEQVVFHNANFDIQALVAIGLDFERFIANHEIHDTMVMSHSYRSSGPHGLKELAISILDFPADDEKRLGDITKAARNRVKSLKWCIADENNPHPSLVGQTKSLYKSDYWIPKQAAIALGINDPEWLTICNEYAEKDVIRTLGLFNVLPELMDRSQLDTYYRNMRTVPAILRMQWEGVPLLDDTLTRELKQYQSKYMSSRIRLEVISGIRQFNPDSPKQLKTVLFDKYGFVSEKTTDSGQQSTDKSVISKLMKDCPSASEGISDKYKFLIEFRNCRKSKTTTNYLTNYTQHRVNNKLYPNFKLTATSTGRLSCENPNTTNVGKADMNNPFAGQEDILGIEGEESFKIRNVFGPPSEYSWTCIDYEQFQLLIFAVVSGSEELIRAYEDGVDLHHAVARTIFGTDDISSVQRTAAKAINFGILFGAGPTKIEETAGIPGLYNQFLNQLPGAKRYLASQEKLARELGYVHTLGGYRLYTPRERPYAASCYAIQGTEAEIVKLAMSDISEYCYHTNWLLDNYSDLYSSPQVPLHKLEKPKKPCNYRMIMMVHDELVFQHKTQSRPHLRNIMRLMENAGRTIGVPVRVSADLVSSNWATKEPIDISL
jgi:DNA polymerase I-like protein with 3'-5' exonuclease and polymerase domains